MKTKTFMPIRGRAGTAATIFALALALTACREDNQREGLGEVHEFASPAGEGSSAPNLTVGTDGRVYLSWVEALASGGHALRFAVQAGDSWGEPRTIAVGENWFVNWADFPSLLVLPDGRMAAHWLQKSGPATYAYDVYLAFSEDGGETWSEGVVLHRDGTQTEHGFVSLWAAPGDSIGAVWLDGRAFTGGGHDHNGPNEMKLMHTRAAFDGGLASERELDARICDCCQTSVAITNNGPVVFYRDRSPEEIRDISFVRLVEDRWTAPQTVHHDGWEIAGCPVNGPFATADGNEVAVAWFTAGQDTARVNIAFSADAGASFAAPIQLDAGAPIGRVAARWLNGGALVSWMEQNSEAVATINVRHVATDGTLGPIGVVAESAAARGSGFPRMVIVGERVVFAWTEPGERPRVRVATANIGAR